MKAVKLSHLEPLPQSSKNSMPLLNIVVPENTNIATNFLSKKIALPTLDGASIEKIDQIVRLEAKGNYTLIAFLDGRNLLVCKTLQDTEALLDYSGQFVRVHRSHCINLALMQRYVKGKGGYVIMENGDTVDVSSGKKQEFLALLRIHFGYE